MQLKLSENIKKYRKQMDLTQEELAENLGVTIGAVSKWENANNVPDILTLMELANFFNVSVDDLLGYEMSSKNVDDLDKSIDEYCNKHMFKEAIEEARNALARYPHNFKILYRAACAYYYKVCEEHRKEDAKTSIDLFNKALAYISQNTDESISEFSIKHRIYELYIHLDQEKALKGFKEINYNGVTNSLIALLLSSMGNREEALKYHSYAMLSCFVDTYSCLTNTASCLAKEGTKKDYEVSLEMLDTTLMFLDAFSMKDKINYSQKLATPVYFLKGYLYELLGETEKMKECIKTSYKLSLEYDNSERISDLSESVKYYFIEKKAYSYDNVGSSAVEGLETIFNENIKELSGKEKETLETVIKYWQSVKKQPPA